MTSLEKAQPEKTFVHAGRLAFGLGVDLSSNPYKDMPFRVLWEKGWRSAKKRFYGNR